MAAERASIDEAYLDLTEEVDKRLAELRTTSTDAELRTQYFNIFLPYTSF